MLNFRSKPNMTTKQAPKTFYKSNHMTAREMALTPHNLNRDASSATMKDGSVYKWSDHFRCWSGPFPRGAGDAKPPK